MELTGTEEERRTEGEGRFGFDLLSDRQRETGDFGCEKKTARPATQKKLSDTAWGKRNGQLRGGDLVLVVRLLISEKAGVGAKS